MLQDTLTLWQAHSHTCGKYTHTQRQANRTHTPELSRSCLALSLSQCTRTTLHYTRAGLHWATQLITDWTPTYPGWGLFARVHLLCPSQAFILDWKCLSEPRQCEAMRGWNIDDTPTTRGTSDTCGGVAFPVKVQDVRTRVQHEVATSDREGERVRKLSESREQLFIRSLIRQVVALPQQALA